MTRRSWIWPCRETSEISPRYQGLIAMHRMAVGGADVSASPDGRGFPSCETISCLITKKSCADSKLMTLRQKKEDPELKIFFWLYFHLYLYICTLNPSPTKQEGWGFVCPYKIESTYFKFQEHNAWFCVKNTLKCYPDQIINFHASVFHYNSAVEQHVLINVLVCLLKQIVQNRGIYLLPD